MGRQEEEESKEEEEVIQKDRETTLLCKIVDCANSGKPVRMGEGG